MKRPVRSSATPPPAPLGLRLVESPHVDKDASVRDAGQHLYSLFRDEILRYQAQRAASPVRGSHA